MNPDEIVRCLVRVHGVAFDYPVTDSQIKCHVRRCHKNPEVMHMISALWRQLEVANMCGDTITIQPHQPYP